ncbi:potassium transport protein Kup [compost metagenome]
MLTVVSEDSPRVSADRRFEVEAYGEGFFRVSLHFGFIEEPDVPLALSLCHLTELDFSPMRTTYFLSRETVIPTKRIGMVRWRESLFAFLLKNANSNLKYFKLPLNRVIELGTQVEM